MDYQVKLKQIKQSTILKKIPDDAIGFIFSQLINNFNQQDLVFIAKNDLEMELIANQLKFFHPNLDQDFEILMFNAWDCLPYDRSSPKSIIANNRIKTLYKIANRSDDKNFILITSINAVMQKIIDPDTIKKNGLFLKIGSKISVDQVIDFLVNNGYNRNDCANNVGEFAVRGGIIDIVLQQAFDLIGYRLDFFGNELEHVKIFDPITQITNTNAKQIEILPASEVILQTKTIENFRKNYRQAFGNSLDDPLYQAISNHRSYQGMEHWLAFFYDQQLVTIFDYLKNYVCFFSDKIFELANQQAELINQYYHNRLEEKKLKEAVIYNPIDPELLYLDVNQIKELISKNINIEFKLFDFSDHQHRIIDLEIQSIPDFALAGRANKQDPIEIFQNFISQNQHKKIILACLSEGFKERISKTFFDYKINCLAVDKIDQIKTNKINLALLNTNFGFNTSDLIVIGEQAIFGEKISRSSKTKKASLRIIEEGLSIKQGELVVHRDHGIGRFEGLQIITSGKIKCEMVKIAYAGNDSLFVCVDDINLITRYGAENPLVQLDKLGNLNWQNRRNKVRSKIRITAEELLKIASYRQLKKSPIFIADANFYEEFKNNFGYIETNDQLNAIEEVENDLSKGIPMDRLICGDVGFGKTEVAMRASAIVAKFAQVAIITPTTLLCRQHFKNFTNRFAKTDIKIIQLSRLTSSAENKLTKKQIEEGTAQIIIGTHSLLQKNIKFFNLGLVIIDEEQHFGVKQKEFLKQLRNEVHILSLSATPIPRTLQMSLSQVKDLSLIATPPLDRLAVRNFVLPFDNTILREAILREYNRSGKTFFVVPRVRDIDEISKKLTTLIPEIKIAIAHGQMNPGQLDQIMNEFVDGKYDLLLSTTIIESGIDIASANTIIIYKAEMFGLAQLYQLRGRVGRGKIRGYCYFMLDNRKHLSDEAKKKLEVMQNLDALGVGFMIANHDMDIRGSGNLLSDEQSGHVRDTGVELYQQMLSETIEDLKNNPDNFKQDQQEKVENNQVKIKLAISLLIPETYISELSLRMIFYKKISNVKNDLDRENLINEMNDRFGKLPVEVINLFDIAIIKNSGLNLGLSAIELVNNGIVIEINNNFKNSSNLLNFILNNSKKIKLISQNRFQFFDDQLHENHQKIKKCFEIINQIKML